MSGEFWVTIMAILMAHYIILKQGSLTKMVLYANTLKWFDTF